MLSLPSISSSQSGTRQARDKTERQPVGFVDSLDGAYEAVSREFHSTLDTLVVMPIRCIQSVRIHSITIFVRRQFQRYGPSGYVRSIVRAIPVAVLRPTAGAAEALSYTLLGLRNNLDPCLRRDEEDMWDVNHSGVAGHPKARQGHGRK